jgi:hypothetical protein
MTACDAPRYSPSKDNPTGGCGQPATRAVALGDTGRWLPLCTPHAERRTGTIPLSEVPEP